MLTCSSPHPYRSGAISRFRRRHLRSENPTGKRGLIVHPHRRFLSRKLSLFLKVDIVLLLTYPPSSFSLSQVHRHPFFSLGSFLISLDISLSVIPRSFVPCFSFCLSISLTSANLRLIVNIGHCNSGQFQASVKLRCRRPSIGNLPSSGGHLMDRQIVYPRRWPSLPLSIYRAKLCLSHLS